MKTSRLLWVGLLVAFASGALVHTMTRAQDRVAAIRAATPPPPTAQPAAATSVLPHAPTIERLPNGLTVIVSVILAFASGFALTMRPLLGAGLGPRRALGLALAADTASIALMEVVDNALMLAIPGAMDAHLGSALFWGSMALALALAGAAAFPLNRWLLARGRGPAGVHALHEEHAPTVGREHHDGHAGHGAGHSGH